MTKGKKSALTTPKDRTTVKSKGFGAALSAVVKKISLGAAAAPLFLNVWRCWEQFK